MRLVGASNRSWGVAIIGAACVLFAGSPAAGGPSGRPDSFHEDFSSGSLDWQGGWDTDSGEDSYARFYRVDRLSAGLLASARQSFCAHSIHDYFHEQVLQVRRPTGERGFWDEANACWAGLLLWSPEDGWYAATPHDWRFSVELEEGALMASVISGGHPMDDALKGELFYIHKRIAEDGTIEGLTNIGGSTQGAYEYGLVLSALALGARYFEGDEAPEAETVYEDMRKVFSRILVLFSERIQACEESAVLLRGYVNAYRAFDLHGDEASARAARSRFESLAGRFIALQKAVGAFDLLDPAMHVQKQLKADIGLLLAYSVTNDTRYVEAAKRNMDWVIAYRWDDSPNCMGGVMWSADDTTSYFECHQSWFILVAKYLEDCSEYSYRPYLEDAFAFLTDDNFAGVDMFEHNAETYGAFFSYRAISRDGAIQKDPFHRWKGAYEIGASLWALASIYGVYSEGHGVLVTQAPTDSSGSWDRALFTERDFGGGNMAIRWDARFKDARRGGAYTGLFNSQAYDCLLLLDTTKGLSYRDIAGRQRVLVDKSLLRSGTVYTVRCEKRGEYSRIRVTLLEDGLPLFDGFVSDMRAYSSCYFGVFQNSMGSSGAKAIFVDNIEYEPIGEGAGPAPEASRMYQGYPNPFNALVRIEYDVAANGPVSLRIYSAAGELVADLVDRVVEPGRYWAVWDGRGAGGAKVASGVYFCSFVTGDSRQTRKVVLVR
jgi:hypothetical protein